MRFTFYDNNVTSLMFRIGNDAKFENFELSLKKINHLDSYLSSFFFVSPSIYLEAVGLKVTYPKFSVKHNNQYLIDLNELIINNAVINGKAINDFRIDLIQKYQDYFKSCIVLSKELLLWRLDYQTYYVSPKLRNNFVKKFKKAIDNELFHNLLIECLSLDQMYNHSINYSNYPGNKKSHKVFSNWIESSSLMDLIHSMQEKKNTSHLRGFKFIWNSFKYKISKRYEQITEPNKVSKKIYYKNILRISKALSFKDNKDLVDLELVQYACLGLWHSDRLQQVDCYTCDSFQDIIIRISFMKSIIKNNLSFIPKNMSRKLKYRYGYVYFVDRCSGSIFCNVDVKNIPPLLDIMTIVDLSDKDCFKEQFSLKEI